MNGRPLIDLFDHAANHLKWPHLIVLYNNGNDRIKFARMSELAKIPHGIIITDGRSFGVNKIYGFVERNGKINLKIEPKGIVYDIIEAVTFNPLDNLKLNGLQYKHCCFCGAELTNKISLHHGYGPICADKWGLPWDTTDD